MSAPEVEVIALSGGVGGAKLTLGLQRTLPSGALAIIVNTGDDFEHLGLAISPDVDTTLYTLAGISDETRGWGRAGESWLAMAELERLGGPTWFRLGDKDLALHLERTRRRVAGEPLSVITADFARRHGVPSHIFPMTDDRVRTLVDTCEGVLEFQDYFVRRRCEPELRRVIIDGARIARAPSGALELFDAPCLKAVVICPSNPYLSIDPILSIACWTTALRSARVPVIAVSPLVGGHAVKGPTTKIMAELGIAPDPNALVRHYAGLIDGLVIDHADAHWKDSCGIPVMVTSTMMNTLADRERLAAQAIEFAQQLRPLPSRRTA